MGTQMVTMAFNLTDMFWLGRVGSDAVAAAGAGGMYMWLSFGFILIGRMGAEIGVAQSLGGKDKKTALAFSQNAMFIAFVLGSLFALALVFFNRPLIGFFNFREKEIADAAADYLFILGFSQLPVFLSFVAVGTYNASGNSRTPFLVNSLGLIINVILDPVFIIFLGMGVRGAAIATIISQFVTSFAMLGTLFFSKNRPFERYSLIFRPDMKRIIRLLKWSVPVGLESLFFCFLSMTTTRIEAVFGAGAVAVARVGSQIEALSWLIGGGFGSAVIAFTGQNYGAGKRERIRQGVKVSLTTMAIWGSIVTLFFVTLGPVVFALFLPAPELATLGRMYLYILAFCQLPMNIEAVGSGAFKGIGRTIPPSIVSISTNAVRPIIALLLSRTSLGIYGVWTAVSATALIRGIWVCLWFTLAERKVKNQPPQQKREGDEESLV